MRTTLVIEVSDELSQFILNQQGLVDPSAFINKLLLDEQARQGGVSASDRTQSQTADAGTLDALEEHLDQQIPSAG